MMYKGPFWIKCRVEIDSQNVFYADFENAEVLTFPITTDSKTPSHKDVWNIVKPPKCKEEWNYYPRGRVEYHRNKAVVYANPIVYQYKHFNEKIKASFNIPESTILVLKNDNSSHYACFLN